MTIKLYKYYVQTFNIIAYRSFCSWLVEILSSNLLFS